MSSNTITDASNALIAHAAQSADAMVHSTQRLANQASDKTVAYIREKPVKSMLIAAATGAALVALARMAVRPGNPH